MKISLILGAGVNPHYEAGLLSGLLPNIQTIDVIGIGEIKEYDILKNKHVIFYNFFGNPKDNATSIDKFIFIIKYYLRLIHYTAKTDSKLFHIQWFNKLIFFDRTILNIIYKLFGKKLIFTAHNIDAQERDGQSTLINRLSLIFMYNIVDHIIVHTDKMKTQLINNFNIGINKITVIPHGIINLKSKHSLTSNEAKAKLNIQGNKKVMLFFGNIAPYKGLEYALLALAIIKKEVSDNFQLIIAGEVKRNCREYWDSIQNIIEEHQLQNNLIVKPVLIPDAEVEIYFKAADVLLLPYNNIFQSGVIFLSYGFGLPVIATDVGSLREDIIEGKTGFVCKAKNPGDLAQKIDLYFNSTIFRNLEKSRKDILSYAIEKYSWGKIGAKTFDVYKQVVV